MPPLRRLSKALPGLALLLLPGLAPAREWPLTGNLVAHDPTLIREGARYWCFYTGAGLPYKTSEDGLHWTLMPAFFKEELPWWREHAPQMGKIDVWAPDIQQFGGRYWLYYSVSEFGKNNSAIGLMSCTSLAAGDWKDEGPVIWSKAGEQPYNAIDPHLTSDKEGNPWLSFGSWFSGICLVPLDPATMKPSGKVRTLAHRENGIEGDNLVYRDGYYHLFVSIDRCCIGVDSTYKIVSGRAREIGGPYLDREGRDLLQGGGTLLEQGAGRWIGPGGQDVTQIGEAWVIARHAYDAEDKGAPTLRIADLYWDGEGWPSLQPQTVPQAR